MLTNAVAMGLKASATIYILPTDMQEGVTWTSLPKGEKMKLQVRHEDAENVKKISKIEHLSVIAQPKEIQSIFRKHFPLEATRKKGLGVSSFRTRPQSSFSDAHK
jgi:flavoprotein